MVISDENRKIAFFSDALHPDTGPKANARRDKKAFQRGKQLREDISAGVFPTAVGSAVGILGQAWFCTFIGLGVGIFAATRKEEEAALHMSWQAMKEGNWKEARYQRRRAVLNKALGWGSLTAGFFGTTANLPLAVTGFAIGFLTGGIGGVIDTMESAPVNRYQQMYRRGELQLR